MIVNILATKGQGSFFETTWEKPEPSPWQIEVRNIMTGVCRSDIDMMSGKFDVLPIHMSGHEGLAQVTKIGKYVTDVKIGDIVATRGEPAYADVYNVLQDQYVQVPRAEPKYILEPIACGINVVDQAIDLVKERQGSDKKLLILGSGFLAWVAYHRVKLLKLNFEITVIGSSNKELWGDKLSSKTNDKFDVIIDLSSKLDVFTNLIYNENALIIMGTQKQVETDFRCMLWKAVTMIFPSPRNPKFYQCMKDAEWMITNGYLDVDSFWTRGYNRKTEWQKAFEDGVNRPEGYSRGYIKWD